MNIIAHPEINSKHNSAHADTLVVLNVTQQFSHAPLTYISYREH